MRPPRRPRPSSRIGRRHGPVRSGAGNGLPRPAIASGTCASRAGGASPSSVATRPQYRRGRPRNHVPTTPTCAGSSIAPRSTTSGHTSAIAADRGDAAGLASCFERPDADASAATAPGSFQLLGDQVVAIDGDTAESDTYVYVTEPVGDGSTTPWAHGARRLVDRRTHRRAVVDHPPGGCRQPRREHLRRGSAAHVPCAARRFGVPAEAKLRWG